MKSRTDYILGMDYRMFQYFDVLETRHNIDHYLLLGCHRGTTHICNQLYLGKRMRLPLHHLRRPSQDDNIFSFICQVAPKTLAHERMHSSCISKETWRVINARLSLCRAPYRDQRRIHNLSHRVWLLLFGYQWRNAVEEVTVVDSLLVYDLPQ